MAVLQSREILAILQKELNKSGAFSGDGYVNRALISNYTGGNNGEVAYAELFDFASTPIWKDSTGKDLTRSTPIGIDKSVVPLTGYSKRLDALLTPFDLSVDNVGARAAALERAGGDLAELKETSRVLAFSTGTEGVLVDKTLIDTPAKAKKALIQAKAVFLKNGNKLMDALLVYNPDFFQQIEGQVTTTGDTVLTTEGITQRIYAMPAVMSILLPDDLYFVIYNRLYLPEKTVWTVSPSMGPTARGSGFEVGSETLEGSVKWAVGMVERAKRAVIRKFVA